MDHYLHGFPDPMRRGRTAQIVARPGLKEDAQPNIDVLHDDLRVLKIHTPLVLPYPPEGPVLLNHFIQEEDNLPSLCTVVFNDMHRGTNDWMGIVPKVPGALMIAVATKPPGGMLSHVGFSYVHIPKEVGRFLELTNVTQLTFLGIFKSKVAVAGIPLNIRASDTIQKVNFQKCDPELVSAVFNCLVRRKYGPVINLNMHVGVLASMSLWEEIKYQFHQVGSFTLYGGALSSWPANHLFFAEAWLMNCMNLCQFCLDKVHFTREFFEEFKSFLFNAETIEVLRINQWKTVDGYKPLADLDELLDCLQTCKHVKWVAFTEMHWNFGELFAAHLPALPIEAAHVELVTHKNDNVDELTYSLGSYYLSRAQDSKTLGAFPPNVRRTHAKIYDMDGLSVVGKNGVTGEHFPIFTDEEMAQLSKHQKENKQREDDRRELDDLQEHLKDQDDSLNGEPEDELADEALEQQWQSATKGLKRKLDLDFSPKSSGVKKEVKQEPEKPKEPLKARVNGEKEVITVADSSEDDE